MTALLLLRSDSKKSMLIFFGVFFFGSFDLGLGNDLAVIDICLLDRHVSMVILMDGGWRR